MASSINKLDPNCESCLGDYTSKEPAVYPVKPGTCNHMLCAKCLEVAKKYYKDSEKQDKRCPVPGCLKGRFISVSKSPDNPDYVGLNESESDIVYMATIASIKQNSINKEVKFLQEKQVEITRNNEQLANLENTRNELLRKNNHNKLKEEYLHKVYECMIMKSIIPSMTFEEYLSEQDHPFSSLENFMSHQPSESTPFPLPCQSQEIFSSVLGNLSILTIKEDLSSLIDRVRRSNDPALECALIIFELARSIPQLEQVNIDLIYRSEHVVTVASELRQNIYKLEKKIKNITLEVQKKENGNLSLNDVILNKKRKLLDERSKRPEYELAPPTPAPSLQSSSRPVSSIPYYASAPVPKPISSLISAPSKPKAPCRVPEYDPSMYKSKALQGIEHAMKFREIPMYDENSSKEIDWLMTEEQIAECLKALISGFNERTPLTVSGLMELIKTKYPDTTFSTFAEALKKSGIIPDNYRKLLERTAARVWKHRNYLRERETRELSGTTYSSSQSGLLSYACHGSR